MLWTHMIRSITSSSLPKANMMVVLHLWASLADKPADATGINDALFAIARLGAGFIGGAVAVCLVMVGYEYMFADSASRGSHLKRGLAIIIGGAILVILAVVVAPQIAIAISTGK